MKTNKIFMEQQLNEQDYKTLVMIARITRVFTFMFKVALLPWYIIVKFMQLIIDIFKD